MNLEKIQYLTFDCYGTLIDWETGILDALRPILVEKGCLLPDAEVLQWYGKFEATAEKGPYKSYREILREVVDAFGSQFGFIATDLEREALPNSVGQWQPFPDSVEALRALSNRYQLVILSNIDRDMIKETASLLGNPFHRIFSAEEIGSYKPDLKNFRYMQEQLGVAKEELLHVAQSKYHDIGPAIELGWSHIWVTRGRDGTGGATPESEFVPEARVEDLEELMGWLLPQP